MNLDRFSRPIHGEHESKRYARMDSQQARDLAERMRYEDDNILRASDLAEHLETALESFDAYKIAEVKRVGSTLYIKATSGLELVVEISNK